MNSAAHNVKILWPSSAFFCHKAHILKQSNGEIGFCAQKQKSVIISKSNNSFDVYHDILLLHLPVFSLLKNLFNFCLLHSLGVVRIKMAVFKIA